jgi:hypothetical protein
MTRRIRQTLIVARRDFTATVFTPTFLLFLLAPFFFMGLSAAIGGLGAASLSERVQRDARIVAIVSPEDGARLRAADTACAACSAISTHRRRCASTRPPPMFRLRRARCSTRAASTCRRCCTARSTGR